MTTERERLAQRSGLRAKETTLRERVAAAISEAMGLPASVYAKEKSQAAHAAIRVVLAEAEKECQAVSLYCGRWANDGDHQFHEFGTGAMACIERLRALAGADSGKGET